MDNQYRLIEGYRELNETEIEIINLIKGVGETLAVAVQTVEDYITLINIEHGIGYAEARRWAATVKTHLQQGLMALTRAIAKPTSF